MIFPIIELRGNVPQPNSVYATITFDLLRSKLKMNSNVEPQ